MGTFRGSKYNAKRAERPILTLAMLHAAHKLLVSRTVYDNMKNRVLEIAARPTPVAMSRAG